MYLSYHHSDAVRPCSSRNSSDGLATADFIHSLRQQTKGASAFKCFSRCLLLSAGYILLLCIKVECIETRNMLLRKKKTRRSVQYSHLKYILCVFFKLLFLFVKRKLSKFCKRIVIDGWCVVSKGKDAISLPAADRAR